MAEFNRDQSKILPSIVVKKDPKDDAKDWRNDDGKIRFIKESRSIVTKKDPKDNAKDW